MIWNKILFELECIWVTIYYDYVMIEHECKHGCFQGENFMLICLSDMLTWDYIWNIPSLLILDSYKGKYEVVRVKKDL